MARLRASLGLIAGLLLILSAAAHSILGWKGLHEQLLAARVPPDLLRSLKIGWQFGGLAMLVLGTIVVALFVMRLRGQNVSSLPALFVALGYLAFGAWAMLATRFDPFFLVFIVPGLLLVVAGFGGSRAGP
jgi:hypothetical protein